MSAADYAYVGDELELFRHARNWKSYWSSQIRPFLGRSVLEVGAGIGANTPLLSNGASQWVCLEPDAAMAAVLAERQASLSVAGTRTVVGVIADLPREPSFDSIIYIDVLEHIEHDAAEIAAATERLRPGGALIVLSPAHNWLFSPFDQAVGHYRRYASSALRALAGDDLDLVMLRQLDSCGLIASLANRLLLGSAMPKRSQILFWDRVMVPVSRCLDPLLGYRFGKSILAVWRRRQASGAAPAMGAAHAG